MLDHNNNNNNKVNTRMVKCRCECVSTRYKNNSEQNARSPGLMHCRTGHLVILESQRSMSFSSDSELGIRIQIHHSGIRAQEKAWVTSDGLMDAGWEMVRREAGISGMGDWPIGRWPTMAHGTTGRTRVAPPPVTTHAPHRRSGIQIPDSRWHPTHPIRPWVVIGRRLVGGHWT